MRMLEPLPEALSALKGREVYALAGTLRAETMCGQTNAWVLPEGEYGAFEASEKVVYLCAARAARNMAFQDLFPTWGAMPKQLLTVFGRQLVGAAVSSPLCVYERIYMLPLTTISMTKGTAIVTSVPSDSPDDYAAFMDLKKPAKREYFGVQAEWIEPFELVAVLRTPDLGEMSAKFMCDNHHHHRRRHRHHHHHRLRLHHLLLPCTPSSFGRCDKLKVQSQKDVEKLKEAHDAGYNSGFYKA